MLKRSSLRQIWARIARALIEPLRSLPTMQEHQARLGAFTWLTLLAFLVPFSMAMAQFVAVESRTLSIGLSSIALAYALSRLGHAQAGAMIMIAVTMLNLGMMAAPEGILVNAAPLYYLIVPIAIAVLFLNLPLTLGVACIALLEVGLIYRSANVSAVVFFTESPFSFLVTVTFILVAIWLNRKLLTQMRYRALEANVQRLRDLIENLPVMVDILDENNTIQLWNKECERVTGYSAAEIIGDPSAFERLYPDQAYREAMRRHFETDSSYRGAVYRLTRKDGTTRLIAWSVVNYRVPELAWQSLSVGVDVTEQYQRERELSAIATIATALRAANSYAEMLPIILDQTYVLMQGKGASLATLEPNAEGERIVVKAARGAWDYHVQEQLDSQHGLYAHVIKTRRPYVTADAYHSPVIARPERLSGLSAVAAAPLIAQNRVFGVVGVARHMAFSEDDVRVLTAICDIAANALQRAEAFEKLEARVQERTAQLEAAYARLAALDQLKTKLIADLAHALRTPLSTLRVQMHLIESDLAHPSVPERLQGMKAQIDRLNKLIEGALDVLRLEVQRNSVLMQPQSMTILLQQLCSRVRMQLSEQQHFEAYIAPNLPKVNGDSALLARALENVLDNALKYTSSGTIALCAEQHGSQIVISISDTGMGIPPDDLPYVFERFYRGRAVGQSNIAGIGLGLTIAKTIIELHGGTLYLQSTPQVGTQVRLYLPAIN
jgi:PAS domain S-box-containing protein